MAKTMTAAMPQVQIVDRGQSERLFYLVAALTMALFTALGFRDFFLHGTGPDGSEITSQIVPLVVAHGLAMFSWIIFFLTQSTLIVIGNRRLHMAIGPVGSVIAAIIVLLASSIASLSVHFNPESYKPLGGARFFLMEMLTDGVVLFGSFVVIGVKYRRRPEIHRPMMLLATVSIMPAALDRCPYIGNLALISPLHAYNSLLLFGALERHFPDGRIRVTRLQFTAAVWSRPFVSPVGNDAVREPVVRPRLWRNRACLYHFCRIRPHHALESDGRDVRTMRAT